MSARPILLAAMMLCVSSRVSARPRDVDVVAHLSQAIRFHTVTTDPRERFAELHAWLEKTYPLVHTALAREKFSKALLYRWTGTDLSLQPILVMAHQDVVPVDPATVGSWAHPPFSGDVADGFVWGRGALDDLGMLVALFETIEGLLAEGYYPARTVYLLAGEDEEVGGLNGAAVVATELQRRHIHFAWVLDEGGSIVQGYLPHVSQPVAAIGVAEKGYATVELIAHAEPGHSSMPPARTAIGLLSHALVKLEENPLPARLSPMMQRSVSQFRRQLRPDGGSSDAEVLHDLALYPGTNAGIRTTVTPTMLEAGVKDNVLPAQARAIVNVRLLPGDTASRVVDHLRAVIADPAIELRMPEHTTFDPVPVASADGPGFVALRETINQQYPGVPVVPALTNGTTDSRHFHRIAEGIYHFAPWKLEPSDLRRIHGIDERLSTSQLVGAVTFFRALLQRSTR